jgi:hypothetical protein
MFVEGKGRMSDIDIQTLTAVSNVIELKPGCKYLLVFKGENIHQPSLDRLQAQLTRMGISSLSVTLDGDIDFQVVEVPE